MESDQVLMSKMELYYYRSEVGNVGDDLNPWLWTKVFGEGFFSDGPEDHVFFGIGSILSHRDMGSRKRYTVFGSGARSYFRNVNHVGRDFDFRFVRGPLTSWKCGGANWITDPAVIVPRYFSPVRKIGRSKIGFVPYYKTHPDVIEAFCRRLDMKVLKPSWGPEEFIEELCSCDEIIAEAMHGAIIADAYRIPWRSVRLSAPKHEGLTALFKWNDWLESLRIARDAISRYPLAGFLPDFVRRPILDATLERRFDNFARSFKSGHGFLSDTHALQDAQDRIQQESHKLLVHGSHQRS